MIKCDICGKRGFKSKAGLAGHKKILHGVEVRTKKTQRDEIEKRLQSIEVQIFGLGQAIDQIFEWSLASDRHLLVEDYEKRFGKMTIVQDMIKELREVVRGKK